MQMTHLIPMLAHAFITPVRHQVRLTRPPVPLAALLVACSVGLAPVGPVAQTSDDVRTVLTSQPLAPALEEAVKQYQTVDPTARFTFLRGHVDVFSAHPKASVPDYAMGVLEQIGQPTNAIPQPVEATTEQPKTAEGNAAVAAETLDGADLGHAGPDDDGVPDDIAPVETDPHEAQTEWYDQQGKELVMPILRRFLSRYNSVFEIPEPQLANGLPNLKLTQFGVGRHFRRAEFTQHLPGDRPVLDGKTLVLFDLNWNVVGISRQIMTPQKLGLENVQTIPEQQARRRALQALGLTPEKLAIIDSTLGADAIRGILAWQVKVFDTEQRDTYTITMNGADGTVLNVSDDTARFNDAQVKRWDYADGDRTMPIQVTTTGVYTHDDNTLVHDFYYLVNDDRNDGGTGVCTATSPDSNSTPNAYGTTTSAEYVRPTRRSDRNFALWRPQAAQGPFGEGHAYYWARKYMQWQKQALVDLGVLTLGNFNNYTKALIIVNACDAGAGKYVGNPAISTMDDLGENLGTIFLPEACRIGNPNCAPSQYQAPNTNLYTFEDDGGYHFPGVIHHELNHFVLIDYFNVNNGLDCSIRKENRYFQEGGIGRTMPQMYWHNHYGIGYEPVGGDTNKLFRSDGTSGEWHDEDDPNTLNALAAFPCGADGGDPYSWGSPVHQPMWKIYHGQKIEGAVRLNMARPAEDKGMIKSIYYAADMASASSFPDRFELANRFMEFWELFSTAIPDTKEDWCEVWGDHGLNTFIDINYCS